MYTQNKQTNKRLHGGVWAPYFRGQIKPKPRPYCFQLRVDFLKVLRFSFPVPVVGPRALALSLSLPPKTLKISISRSALEKHFELDLKSKLGV